jgi:hypothetical protein
MNQEGGQKNTDPRWWGRRIVDRRRNVYPFQVDLWPIHTSALNIIMVTVIPSSTMIITTVVTVIPVAMILSGDGCPYPYPAQQCCQDNGGQTLGCYGFKITTIFCFHDLTPVQKQIL